MKRVDAWNREDELNAMLPLLPHELFGPQDCGGCLVVDVGEDGKAVFVCYECAAVIQSDDVDRVMLERYAGEA